MNVANTYSWKSPNSRENSPLLPNNIRGLIIGKSNCGKTTLIFNLLLQPGWLDYNHLYVFGKSLHQIEYKIIRRGFEEGLSKRQISNLFIQQDILTKVELSPLEARCLRWYKRGWYSREVLRRLLQYPRSIGPR